MAPATPCPCVPFTDAMMVEELDSHTYRVELNESYCSNGVPNGGYVASCMLVAANAHLKSFYSQPDTVTAHFEFPSRTSPGPAIIVIEDTKISGSLLSTLHLTLWQHGLQSQKPWISPNRSKRIVLAYATHGDARRQEGISIRTAYEAAHSAAPSHELPAFEKLRAAGEDDEWKESLPPEHLVSSLPSLSNWRFFLPRSKPAVPGFLDMWVSTNSGERITQAILPYVVDSFPFNLHDYTIDPEALKLYLNPSQHYQETVRGPHAGTQRGKNTPPPSERASLWLPTVLINLETKKPLPTEGVEWLSVRVTTKQMKLGRFDLEIIVRDVEGEMIALSHHVALVLDISRSGIKKSQKPTASSKSLL
ncbi:thioesterase family protein [Astrocystis sublimbata]|nr:thioesterase family protein [Astrocystis sublimbata]KAI0186923.1 thioesterase family protein [Astrocystis sublimbata]